MQHRLECRSPDRDTKHDRQEWAQGARKGRLVAEPPLHRKSQRGQHGEKLQDRAVPEQMQVQNGGTVGKGGQDYANGIEPQQSRQSGGKRPALAAKKGKGAKPEYDQKSEIELIRKRLVAIYEVIGPELFEKRDIVETGRLSEIRIVQNIEQHGRCKKNGRYGADRRLSDHGPNPKLAIRQQDGDNRDGHHAIPYPDEGVVEKYQALQHAGQNQMPPHQGIKEDQGEAVRHFGMGEVVYEQAAVARP